MNAVAEAELKFDSRVENVFARLPGDFYTPMAAERMDTEPRLIHGNKWAAALIGLDPAAFHDPVFTEIFSGRRPFPGGAPLAMVYGGHQFGVWAGRLGDGRALLLAQLRDRCGDLWDVQLKGAGRTPYSRFADGRAVMRSTVREYLAGEALAGLGIPTTRALCIMATGEVVRREKPEPGAMLTRLARSHIRFGHFEYFHHRGRHDLVRSLADHVIENYMPQFVGDYARWFAEVVGRTARLIAQWQAAGFAHGVMNTDNMSILGLTLDYGPFGFLEAYAPGFVCNHSDEGGRYAFASQPAVAHWNLQALAVALSSLVPVESLVAALNAYEAQFEDCYRTLMRAKLGFTRSEAGDGRLADELLDLMARAGADYTLTFYELANPGESWLARFGLLRGAAADWLSRYGARMRGEAPPRNPRYVLRNWVAEVAIRAVEDRGDAGPLDRIFRLLQTPCDSHSADAAFAAPPAPEYRGLSVSCSS